MDPSQPNEKRPEINEKGYEVNEKVIWYRETANDGINHNSFENISRLTLIREIATIFLIRNFQNIPIFSLMLLLLMMLVMITQSFILLFWYEKSILAQEIVHT